VYTIDDIQLIDGATGSELERRGVELPLPLWSTHALMHFPDQLEAVHRDYLEAGSQAITTATFRTHRRTLEKVGLEHRRQELTTIAVEVAARARDQINPQALVLGSVAPLEDCYRPDLAPDAETCRREHRQLIDDLRGAGADMVLIETMNNLTEATAAIEVAEERMPGRWMVSFCLDAAQQPGTLLSGEPISAITEQLQTASMVGVNCVAAPEVADQVQHLVQLLPEGRVLGYGNIGHADGEGNWHRTDATSPFIYGEYGSQWLQKGASAVGGCCGTSPAHIQAIADRLH